MKTIEADVAIIGAGTAGMGAYRADSARAGLRRTAISVVFSDPQIAMVGMTYRQAESGYIEK